MLQLNTNTPTPTPKKPNKNKKQQPPPKKKEHKQIRNKMQKHSERFLHLGRAELFFNFIFY